MQYYLSAIPGETAGFSAQGLLYAHVAYRIGPDSTLLRRNLLLETRGGLLSVSSREAPQISDPTALCEATLRECNRRSYNGAVLDFEPPCRRDLLQFAKQLAPLLHNSKRILYVPEDYAHQVPQASPIICTALSGGDLTERLKQAASRYPKRHLALDVQRLCMDFALPARSGEGIPLSDDAFKALLQEKHPSIFFSPALCTRYFTYVQNGIAHFVLFDDADTLRQKVRIGNQLGFSTAFFQWPEISDIAAQLFHH